MKRNILNGDGQIIGQLELPDNTSEEVWAKKLSLYAVKREDIEKVQSEEYVEQSSEVVMDTLTRMAAQNVELLKAEKMSYEDFVKVGEILNPMAIYILLGASQVVSEFISKHSELIEILGKDRIYEMISKLDEQAGKVDRVKETKAAAELEAGLAKTKS